MTNPSRPAGSQTLARGLVALAAVASSEDGLSIQQLAEMIDVHRTIAYRILSTLSDAGLVHRGVDNRYRGASGLIALSQAAYSGLRAVCLPPLRVLADDLRSTVSLLVKEGGEAVAVAVIEPRVQAYQMSFTQGSRHPLSRGAAGHAIMSSMPPNEDDSQQVTHARKNGYAITYGEIEPNLYALAAPIFGRTSDPPACVNLISNRQEVVEDAIDRVLTTAQHISFQLQA